MFNVISKINQLLFLLVAILLISLFASELYEKWTRDDPYKPSKITISSEGAEEKIDVELTKQLKLKEILKDIYVFSVENEVVDPSKYREPDSVAEYKTPTNGHYSEKTVNYIFANTKGYKQILLKKDALILTFLPANLGEYEGKPNFDKNIYHIVEHDTNGDGFLTRNDSQSLYLSDYNGKNLKFVVKGVQSSFILDENTLIIVAKSGREKSFFNYSVNESKLIKIDVNTKLTSSSG